MLSFLCSAQFWGEVAKMVAQFAGATLIAWLTVKWALGRYKSEKMWERESAAMFEVLSAIGEMIEVNAEWIHDLGQEINSEGRLPFDPAEQAAKDAQLSYRWHEAKRKLQSVSSIASIVVPYPAAKALAELLAKLSEPTDDYLESLANTDTELVIARGNLVSIARERFGLDGSLG